MLSSTSFTQKPLMNITEDFSSNESKTAYHKINPMIKNLKPTTTKRDQDPITPKLLSNQVNIPNDKILIHSDFGQNQEYILKANISMMNNNVPKLMPIEKM